MHGANFAPGAPLAAGSIISLFGEGLAESSMAASALPLPTQLSGTAVLVDNLPAPLFFVSRVQVNFQMPWEAAGRLGVRLEVTRAGIDSNSITVDLAAVSSGVFTLNQAGTGPGAILIANTSIAAAPAGVIPDARPAQRGEFISIFATGLGTVSDQPATGAAAPAGLLPRTLAAPSVTIGGIPASVTYSGLAPGFVGLYQIDVRVPENAPSGNAIEVLISSGGFAANPVTLAIQ